VAAEEGEPGRAVAADPEPEAPARRLSRACQGPQEGHRQGRTNLFQWLTWLIFK
jgi:hypothetical protein